MKSSKRLLSPSLYKEGLRQLLPAGLLFGLLSIGLSLAQVIFIAIDDANYGGLKLALSDLTGPALVILVVAVAFAFIAVFYLFNFLNKRGSADFYHALPASRPTLYFSFSAAILTWVWGAGLLALLLIVTAALISGISLTFALIVTSFGLFLSTTLFALGASLLAISITGTLFSNLVVTVLIVSVPYFITSCFVNGVAALVPSIPVEFIGMIGNVSLHNTFFMLAEPLLSGGSASGPAAAVPASIIATLVWSVALMGAGAWFFRRRKSEMAGTSASSKGFRLVYRVTLAVLVTVIGIRTFIGASTNDTKGLTVALSSVPARFLQPMATTILIALVAFLVLEFVMTRRWLRLLSVLPSFALVLAFVAVLFGAIFLYSAYENRFAPVASQIASVRLLSSNYGDEQATASLTPSLFFPDDQQISYNQLRLQQLTIKDPTLLRATADKLREPLNADTLYDSSHGAVPMLIEVRTKTGRVSHRLISVRTGAQSDSFNQALLDAPEVAHALLALPRPNAQTQFDGNMFPMSTAMGPAFVSFGEQQRANRKLFDIFSAEYQNLSPEKQGQIQSGVTQLVTSTETTTIADFTRGGFIQVSGMLNMRGFTNTYTFITPKASEYQWQQNCLDLRRALDAPGSKVHVDAVSLYMPPGLRNALAMDGTSDGTSDGVTMIGSFWAVKSQRHIDEFSAPKISEAAMQRATAIIQPALSRRFMLDAPYYAQISYAYYPAADEANNQATLTVSLTAQEAAALQALTKK